MNTNKTPQWEEELAKTLMEITAKYQTWNYAMNLYSPLKDFIKSTLEAERTRIIKALEGLKVEALMHPMQVLDKERVHQLDNYGAGFDSALDQAIKAVEKGNK